MSGKPTITSFEILPRFVMQTMNGLVMTMASPQKGRHAYPDDSWRAEWGHVREIFNDAADMEELGGIPYLI